MSVLRIVGVLLGCGIFFLGLMPHIGLITDWETIDATTKLLASGVSGLAMGTGFVLIMWASGLSERLRDL